ncbi:ATP-binding cassette domain-containing protein, partial [Pelosinus sp. sgz500959]|uniref:ATP-binding cassette domain-containing protein n=1 Tax=Pelosinus sp. sgz500959 TaxID=3242472 RepID=UPI003670BA89
MKYAESCNFPEQKRQILSNMIAMSIGYLSLDRIISTLSGGELVRLYLAEFITKSSNVAVIIDELSIGLDHDTLINILAQVEKLGKSNQILMIDHSDTVLDSTEKNIFFGPGSGKNGGTIVEVSPRPEPKMFSCDFNVSEDEYIFKDLYCRNIQIAELSIPKNRLIAITGESGCGKSTLVNECIVGSFDQLYKKEKIIIVGQGRSQSITSKSTIATFLELKKKLDKLSQDAFDSPIEDIIEIMPKDIVTKKRLGLLLELGLGYLSLNRKIQSLSTGEFQCIHLISEMYGMNNDVPTLFIFDEPSKGLSQNILNKFISCMREILQNELITIMIIEHNRYMLSNSDYVIDFGKRSENSVRKLDIVQSDIWIKKNVIISNSPNVIIKSKLLEQKGITFLDEKGSEYFNKAENIFKGGILKNLSQTARWIYDEYDSEVIAPVIAIDFERQLYSKNTFVYEIAGVLNSIIVTNSLNTDVESFDIYNTDNHCKACRGNGSLEVFDFDLVVENTNVGLWDGLLKNEIMTALKKYNFSKIKFLFKEIKKETKCELSKNFDSMTDREKIIFLHGYWENSFYDNQKKTTRTWQGILFLINKYMRQSKGPTKDSLNNSKHKIICPICQGKIFNH